MITLTNLWKRLKSRKYRKAFAATQLKQSVPFQVKAMRKARGWSQQKLADRCGLPQGTISRYEDLNYGDLTFNVILQIANGFDVAFVGRFVPFSELTRWYTNLSDELHVPTFEEEYAAGAELGAEVGRIAIEAKNTQISGPVRMPPRQARRMDVQAGSDFGESANAN